MLQIYIFFVRRLSVLPIENNTRESINESFVLMHREKHKDCIV